MSEILSQAEIDALLSALSTTGDSTSSESGKAEDLYKKKVRVYDFKRPNKFSKEQIHTIQAIHENYARLLATFFSAHFRTVVQINVHSVEQLTYEEFIRSMPNPTNMNIFTLDPLAGNAIIEINPLLVFTMIDRLFGGVGEPLEKFRAMTDIERSVIEKVVQRSLNILKEAWENIIEFHPKLDTIETNPQFTQIVSPTEMVVLVSLEAKIGDNVGLINLCFPFIVLEPIINKLSAHFWFAGTAKELTTEHIEKLQRRIERSKIDLSVNLGIANITLGGLLELQRGDCIQLDKNIKTPMDIMVGSKVKFAGIPGLSGSKMAVQITSVIKEGDEGNE